MDFMFMGDEGSDRTLAMLVVRERSNGMTMATVAPRKSSGLSSAASAPRTLLSFGSTDARCRGSRTTKFTSR